MSAMITADTPATAVTSTIPTRSGVSTSKKEYGISGTALSAIGARTNTIFAGRVMVSTGTISQLENMMMTMIKER